MTDGPYLLGIDFGTGGARVGIFDPEGAPLVFSEREYTLEHPRPGWAEQDPDEWWFEIGLRWEDFEATYSRARTIRKRHTVLDLAFETGILEGCVGELFAPDGFWGRAAASHTRTDGTRLVGSIRSDVREKHDDR